MLSYQSLNAAICHLFFCDALQKVKEGESQSSTSPRSKKKKNESYTPEPHELQPRHPLLLTHLPLPAYKKKKEKRTDRVEVLDELPKRNPLAMLTILLINWQIPLGFSEKLGKV